MAKISKEKKKEVIKEVREILKDYMKFLTSDDIYEILKGCPTSSIHSALNRISVKRKEKSKLDIYLETFISNYYIANGRLPSLENITKHITKYLPIPSYEVKDFYGKKTITVPKASKKIIMRVKDRVRKRIKAGKLKNSIETIDLLTDLVKKFQNNEIDEVELIANYQIEKVWLNNEQKEFFEELFYSLGISDFYFIGKK